jgi:pimeloyl-ACP methyl ester carboxylesterase
MTSQVSVDCFKHQLPNGLHLEVLHQPAVTPAPSDSSAQSRPPLLFLHGAGHAAWCWQVRTVAQPQR